MIVLGLGGTKREISFQRHVAHYNARIMRMAAKSARGIAARQ